MTSPAKQAARNGNKVEIGFVETSDRRGGRTLAIHASGETEKARGC